MHINVEVNPSKFKEVYSKVIYKFPNMLFIYTDSNFYQLQPASLLPLLSMTVVKIEVQSTSYLKLCNTSKHTSRKKLTF